MIIKKPIAKLSIKEKTLVWKPNVKKSSKKVTKAKK
jgi:hypothetical protein